MISTAPPFILRLFKDERRVFQQNRIFRIPSKLVALIFSK